jgi:hypothetical protein
MTRRAAMRAHHGYSLAWLLEGELVQNLQAAQIQLGKEI